MAIIHRRVRVRVVESEYIPCSIELGLWALQIRLSASQAVNQLLCPADGLGCLLLNIITTWIDVLIKSL